MQMHRKCLVLGAMSMVMITNAQAADSPAPASAAPSTAPVRNQQVIDKVVQMGEHLRTLKSFQLDASTSQDVVLDNGQKIKLTSTSKMTYGGQQRLRAEVDGEKGRRNFFYDGKHFTLQAPRLGYYATVELTGSIPDLVDQIEAKYDLQIPLIDTFLFGRTQAQIDAIQSAAYVGPSKINGQLCDHLAFRQDKTDWQLWITRSDKPMPCKLVITSTDQPEQPEYSAVFRWNLAYQAKAGEFSFKPGKADQKIPLNNAASGQQK